MPQYDANNMDCNYVQCAVCDNDIRGGRWYARVRHEELMLALCCPLCMEVFQTKPDAYVRRIEMLERAPTREGISMPNSTSGPTA